MKGAEAGLLCSAPMWGALAWFQFARHRTAFGVADLIIGAALALSALALSYLKQRGRKVAQSSSDDVFSQMPSAWLQQMAQAQANAQQMAHMMYGQQNAFNAFNSLGGAAGGLGSLGQGMSGGGGSVSVTTGGTTWFGGGGGAGGSPSVQMGNRYRRHPDYPSTFGWRAWKWDATQKLLCSPQQGTPWHGAELRVEHWDETQVVRGVAGIHAEFVPEDWETQTSDYTGAHSQLVMALPVFANQIVQFHDSSGRHYTLEPHPNAEAWLCKENGFTYAPGQIIALGPDNSAYVHGIVERFGKYALGTEGWRAEWVIMRKLLAPSTEVGLALEAAYPDVEIIYPKESEDGHR